MAKTKQPRKPRGKNRQYQHNTVELSRCGKCGSTNRTKYYRPVVNQIAGVRCSHCNQLGAAGERCAACGGTFNRPFEKIVRRRTKCADCDQFRIDTSYE